MLMLMLCLLCARAAAAVHRLVKRPSSLLRRRGFVLVPWLAGWRARGAQHPPAPTHSSQAKVPQQMHACMRACVRACQQQQQQQQQQQPWPSSCSPFLPTSHAHSLTICRRASRLLRMNFRERMVTGPLSAMAVFVGYVCVFCVCA